VPELWTLGVIRTMRAIRILLLLFMTFWILLMAGCPGMYDSIRMQRAFNHYYDAPNEKTRQDLDEARRLDRRDILVYESIMAAILGAAIYGFIRAGRKVDNHAT
jgi:hypothetical protein